MTDLAFWLALVTSAALRMCVGCLFVSLFCPNSSGAHGCVFLGFQVLLLAWQECFAV